MMILIRTLHRPALLIALLLAALFAVSARAHEEGETLYIPIGGFYAETFPGFVDAAIAHAEHLESDRVYVLVMPMSFTSDPFALTQEDLLLNTRDAERRRRQLEAVCRERTTLDCQAVVPPIYVREAAESDAVLRYFADDLAGVYFLGGDQVYAMQITASTPLEQALAEAFASGVPMGGNSAGLAIGSRAMIAGYGGDDFGPENGFNAGAVEVWNSDEERGLSFGSTRTVLEQHFWERARLARFLNALTREDVPPIGIGVDSFTGGLLHSDSTLDGVFGLYTAVVLDVETLGARGTANFDSGVLSIRDVLVHTLAPGAFAYDIQARAHSLAAPISAAPERADLWTLPEGAGSLTLLGGNTFVSPYLAADAPGYILLAGYADAAAAAEATGYTDGQGAFFIDADTALPANLASVRAIALIVGDASLIDAAQFQPIAEAWRGGVDLVLAGDAVGLAGQVYTAMPPTPYDTDDDLLIEAATQGVLLAGNVPFAAGLGLLPVNVEPRLMADNRYGRLFALAYAHPDALAVGISDEAVVRVTADGALVGGANAVLTLDLSAAALATGDNDGLVIANGVIDVFAPGDRIG
jgi:cyanophycinase-like exopeptidase